MWRSTCLCCTNSLILHKVVHTAQSLYRVISWINDYLALKIVREKGISFLFKIREKGHTHAIHMQLWVKPPGNGWYITGYALLLFIKIDTLFFALFEDFQSRVSGSSLDIFTSSGWKCNILKSKFECRQAETNQILKIEAFLTAKWLIKHFAFFTNPVYFDNLYMLGYQNFWKKHFGIASDGAWKSLCLFRILFCPGLCHYSELKRKSKRTQSGNWFWLQVIGFDCKDMKYTIIINRSAMFSVQATQFSSVQCGAVQCWLDWPDLQNLNVFIHWTKADCDDTKSRLKLEQKIWIIFPWTKLFFQTRKEVTWSPRLGFDHGSFCLTVFRNIF